MAIKKYKPTTNGRRNMTTLANDRITKSTPEKSLLAPKKSKGGRGNTGRITAALVALLPVYSKLLKKINTNVAVEDNGEMAQIEIDD